MDWYLILYIFTSIVIGLGGTNYLFKSGRMLTAIIFLVGSIIIFVFYGTRWFQGGSALNKKVEWPPVVNTCPDYLTYYKRTTAGSTQNTCIDMLGVSKKSGVLSPWLTAYTPANPPTSDAYYFNLDVGQTDVQERKKILCQNAIAAGLTWEGITDGEVCTFPGATPTAAGETATTPKCVP
jgi:hypothetical protein